MRYLCTRNKSLVYYVHRELERYNVVSYGPSQLSMKGHKSGRNEGIFQRGRSTTEHADKSMCAAFLVTHQLSTYIHMLTLPIACPNVSTDYVLRSGHGKFHNLHTMRMSFFNPSIHTGDPILRLRSRQPHRHITRMARRTKPYTLSILETRHVCIHVAIYVSKYIPHCQ